MAFRVFGVIGGFLLPLFVGQLLFGLISIFGIWKLFGDVLERSLRISGSSQALVADALQVNDFGFYGWFRLDEMLRLIKAIQGVLVMASFGSKLRPHDISFLGGRAPEGPQQSHHQSENRKRLHKFHTMSLSE